MQKSQFVWRMIMTKGYTIQMTSHEGRRDRVNRGSERRHANIVDVRKEITKKLNKSNSDKLKEKLSVEYKCKDMFGSCKFIIDDIYKTRHSVYNRQG